MDDVTGTRNQGSDNKKFRLTGTHVLIMMVAFFGVIISVNFTMAWFASGSWTGLVVKSSYVASQDFNKNLAIAKEQKQRGWKMAIGYEKSSLSVTLKDKNGKPITAANIILKIGRPVSREQDIVISATHSVNGQYNSQIDLGEGLWDFSVDTATPHSYHIEGRLIVSKLGIGKLL